VRSIPVAAPSSFTTNFLYGVAIVFVCFLGYLYANPSATAPLTPEQSRGQALTLLAMLGLLLVLLGGVLWAVSRRSLTLDDNTLVVRAGFYTRRIPRSSLRMADAAECSLLERRELAPRWRTNGIRVPGFQAGWFRLVNKEKALVLLTNPQRVTYLPTTAGFVLLVSAIGLLEALEALQEPAR
jgi:hypothetical protein